jgi:UDP-N-acetylglucosamine diphosphorylase/glucosamine-1-phosphate N-acetyltransferase
MSCSFCSIIVSYKITCVFLDRQSIISSIGSNYTVVTRIEMVAYSHNLAFIVLAAGLGKRMKSNKAKVLHEVLGTPMVHYVLETATQLADRNVYVIVGYQSEIVRSSIEKKFEVYFVYQEKQLGTGHAVSCALPCLDSQIQQVVILCGDTPLISQSTIELLIRTHRNLNNDLTVLGVNMVKPTGYGRILLDGNQRVSGIVEEADATDVQRNIKIVNTGIYCVERAFLMDAIGDLTNHNAQKELYLTDIVEIGFRKNKSISAVIGEDAAEMMGVNSQEDLRLAEEQMRFRLSKNLDFHISP